MKTQTIEIDDYLVAVLESSLIADCDYLSTIAESTRLSSRKRDWAAIEYYADHVLKMVRIVRKYHDTKGKRK